MLFVLIVGERVVVVTHGGFIRSLYKRACPNGRTPGKVLNTSVSVFHLDADDKWILKMWGDVSHLSQTGFLQSGFGGDRTSG
jgi:probable phosphoglycerate mutase